MGNQQPSQEGKRMSIKTKEEFYKEIEERFPYNNIEILEYDKASGPIVYKCLNCGRIYKKNRANHIYENKTLCQKCYTARDSEIRNKFINKINKDSKFELVKLSPTVSERSIIKCKNCEKEINIFLYNYIKENYSCPYCGKNGAPVPQEEYEKRLEENGKENYIIISYKNITSPMLIKHSCGFTFSTRPDNFLKSRGCPKCFRKMSKGEQKIYNYLKSINIEFETQKRFSNSKLLNTKSYDFFIPSKKVLIEYQGEQHYKPAGYWGGEEKFKKQQYNDKVKREYARQEGYTLIEIPYTQQDKICDILSFLEGSTTTCVDSSESKEKLK